MLSVHESPFVAPIGNWPLAEWMILENVQAEMSSSWTITLNLTRRPCKIMSSTFWAHFLWRCFHWPTCTWIVFNRFPTLLKLLGPKLYLVVGKWNITIYSIHPFMNFFRLFPLLSEEFYYGTKLKISHVHCRPARHWTFHLICECGFYMSKHVPTCTCKVTPGVTM